MDTPDKDVTSALSAVLSNSGSWYTSRKSNTSSTSLKRRTKTSSKKKMPNKNIEDGSLSDDSEKSYKSDDVSSKRKKSYEEDDESSTGLPDSEIQNDFDEPAFKKSRFSFTGIPEDTSTANDRELSPILEVDPSLLQVGNEVIVVRVDHETPVQTVDNDPLLSAPGELDMFKNLSEGEEFDEDYLFQK